MGISIWHILVVVLVIVLLFGVGKGKIPQIMGDLGKGLRSFKDGLKDGDDKPKAEILPPSDKKDV
ncbi:MAG: twin-arginine translocase TatA/TatE family subunit [bacterium]|nr:twin-arginine translocase TatA/TatE family subunit [bacterium]MDI1227781.1 twin-arginine translocase TatA/TatE family subunit [bacterium]